MDWKNLISNFKEGNQQKSICCEKQNFPNVQEYFERKFNIEKLPKDFLSFMQEFDGFRSEKLCIFSITSLKPLPVLTYENYSGEQNVKKYFNKYGVKEDGKFFFIGSDGIGGRYALKLSESDGKIYYFSQKQPSKTVIFQSFEDLMKDKLFV